MAEASSPPSMDIDVVVDLHTNATAAAAAAHALLNENSSNASSDAGLSLKFPVYSSSSDTETDDYHIQRNRLPLAIGGAGNAASAGSTAATTSTSVEVVRSSSPPPNCAICLGRCKNKCFTDSCVHQFCFKCLCEWSKVKAECPLCKQAFRSIIHNVKAIDQYEEYLVQQPVVQIPHSPLEVTYQGPLNSGFILNGTRRFYNFSMRSWNSQSSHHGLMGSRGGPITIRNFTADDSLIGNSIPTSAVAVETLPTLRSELLNLYRQELPDEISSTMSLGQLWRRYIYDRKLYALPVSDITGRYRESSARFYRNNPGQRVRLIPFANRDILCLLRNTNHDVTTVLESLNEGLEVSNILSRSFRRRLQPYLGDRTAHFIHELSNFARSPYDMIGYDRAVQYAPQAADEDHVIEFSSSSEEETNNNSGQNENSAAANTMNLTTNEGSSLRHTTRRNAQATSTTARNRNPGTSEFRVQSRSSAQVGMHSPMSLLSFTITTTSEGSETPGLSVAVSAGSRGHAQVAAINLSTHNRAHNEVVIDLDDTVELNGSSSGDGASTANTNSTATATANINSNNTNTVGNVERPSPAQLSSSIPESAPQIVASIALSTSSSDECEFVLERKPPHLRTPEMVSLNSESDSDVVFVEETKPIIAEGTYSTSENEAQPSLARLMTEQQDIQQPSTSTGLRPRTLRRLVASKRQSTSSQQKESIPSKKRRMRTRRLNTPPENTSDASTSDEPFDANDSEYNVKRRLRGRASVRKRATCTRKGNSSRGGPKKRKRTVVPKNETVSGQESDQNSNATLTKKPKTKKRRISKKPQSVESINNARHFSSSAKHTSSSDEESSTEEDEKVNLKALQLRLKKSLSDVEENTRNNAFNYSPVYSPPARYSEMSQESNPDTANSSNSFKIDNNTNNNNDNNNHDSSNNNINADDNDNAGDSISMVDEPSCSNAASLRQATDNFISQKLAARATPPQMPTTSAAAAAAAAAPVISTVSTYNEHEQSASFEESNGSFLTSCIASTSEIPQEQQEETQARYHLGSMSPDSSCPGSVEPYVPQRLTKDQVMSLAYEANSPNSPNSNSSIDSYQLPSTSQKHIKSYSPSTVKEQTTDAYFNDSGSSNSSTTSSSSSSSAWSDSEEEHNSDENT